MVATSAWFKITGMSGGRSYMFASSAPVLTVKVRFFSKAHETSALPRSLATISDGFSAAESETETEAEAESETETEAEAEAESETETETEAEAEAEAETEAEAVAVAVAVAVAEAVAALLKKRQKCGGVLASVRHLLSRGAN